MINTYSWFPIVKQKCQSGIKNVSQSNMCLSNKAVLEENICGGTAKIAQKKNNFKKFHKHFLDSIINCVPLDSHNGTSANPK